MEVLYFDGGCKPNPGIMEVCTYYNGISNHQRNLGHGTSNQAEWLSFLLTLETAKEYGLKEIKVVGDSTLVVNQANGKWQIKNEHLKPFYDEYKKLKNHFTKLVIEYIPRERNRAGMVIEGLIG